MYIGSTVNTEVEQIETLVFNWGLIITIVIILGIFLLPVILYIKEKKKKADFDKYIQENKESLYDKYKTLIENCKAQDLLVKQLSTDYTTYLEELGLNKTFHCSSNILNNASNDALKALIKYSNVSQVENSSEKIKFCANFLNLASNLDTNTQILRDYLNSEIPEQYKTIHIDLVYDICNITVKNYSAYFIFQYISPAGKSQRHFSIPITSALLNDLYCTLSKKEGKKEFAKVQRSIMTKDLREAIKQRDNYTCCKCGNSVLNEPNLLLEVDHIIPISKGGKTEANNLQTLCWRCNREKADNIE